MIYKNITEFNLNPCAVTLGKFDGLHIGHRKLIDRVKAIAKEENTESTVFSFDTSIFRNVKLLNTTEERVEIYKTLGVDNVIFYPVNEKTMGIEPEDFIKNVLVNDINAKYIVTGEDFRFGHKRRGDVDTLGKYMTEYRYTHEVVKSVMLEDTKVSSSAIKELLSKGNIQLANEMLGYEYFIMDYVKEGRHIGRTIDTRTINVIPKKNKFLPKSGVYATFTEIDGVRHKSITNVGVNPTVSNDGKITVETHILNFDKNIYGKDVKIIFRKFIRNEKKFPNLQALKSQIRLDISQANL